MTSEKGLCVCVCPCMDGDSFARGERGSGGGGVCYFFLLFCKLTGDARFPQCVRTWLPGLRGKSQIIEFIIRSNRTSFSLPAIPVHLQSVETCLFEFDCCMN